MNGNAKEVIQEEEMDNIMLALNNDIDSIILTLNNLKMKLYDTKEYFKGDVADNFNDKFEDYFAQYEVLKDNLNTYVNDLINIKTMVGKLDDESFNKLSESVAQTKKEVEERYNIVDDEKKQISINADLTTQKELHEKIEYEKTDN